MGVDRERRGKDSNRSAGRKYTSTPAKLSGVGSDLSGRPGRKRTQLVVGSRTQAPSELCEDFRCKGQTHWNTRLDRRGPLRMKHFGTPTFPKSAYRGQRFALTRIRRYLLGALHLANESIYRIRISMLTVGGYPEGILYDTSTVAVVPRV